MEALIKMSGALTSVTVLLIVLFLFKEGTGLFRSPVVERGFSVVLHSQNPLSELSPEQLKEIFDQKVDSWSAVGGADKKIRVLRWEDVFSLYTQEELGESYALLPEKLGEIIRADSGIIAYLPEQYIPKGAGIKLLEVKNIGLTDFFMGKSWMPTATPAPLFGILPLVLGTLLVSFIAILIAIPLGVGVAVYLAEIAGEKVRKLMKPAIELLAGIPSVVYGFFGLVVLAPLVQKAGGLSYGETAFTGSLILAIMALPTIISIAEDALKTTPQAMREASYALGATQWQTIYKVVIPYASSGISAAIVLGIGRAIGETMAVLMVTGNAAQMPHSVFDSVRTIPATIAAELGEAPGGGPHYQALFLLGCVLFVITLGISILAETVAAKKTSKA